MICSSWLNVLLVFVPMGFVSHLVDANPLVVFASNALAIVPLSVLLTDATEKMATHAGDTIGALLSISLGNLVELILLVTLRSGHVRIVQASMLGSILVNLLLILGSALLVGSSISHEPSYNPVEAQLLACLLFVSIFAFLMPTAFNYTYHEKPSTGDNSLMLSRISSLLILVIYVVYLVHELGWHSRHERNNTSGNEDDDEESHMFVADENYLGLPPFEISVPQPVPQRIIRFADQGSFGPVPSKDDKKSRLHPKIRVDCFQDGVDQDFEPRGRHSAHMDTESLLSIQPLLGHNRQVRSRSHGSHNASTDGDLRRACSRSSLTALQMLHDSRLSGCSGDDDAGDPHAVSNVAVASSVLILSSILMSLCAQLLADAIDDVTQQTRLSEALIGLIVLPVVGNVAEYVTVVSVAGRDKLDLAIAVAVGSSIQVALCVTPLTVLAGWVMHRQLALTFNFFEMATLMGGVLLVNLLVLNDSGGSLRMSALKGALMCACYVVVGLGAFFAPETK